MKFLNAKQDRDNRIIYIAIKCKILCLKNWLTLYKIIKQREDIVGDFKYIVR